MSSIGEIELLRAMAAPRVVLALVFGFLATLTVLTSWAGFVTERSRYGRRRRIWEVALAPGQYRWEAVAGVRFVLIATLAFTLAISSGAIHLGPTSAASFAATFFSCLLFFEVFYYFLHRALHTKALVRFHRHHHRSKVGTPLTGLSMSVVETLGWMVGYLAPPLVLSRFLPVSIEAWALYLVYHWGGNIIGHINVELMPPLAGRRVLSLFAHPFTYHALHHARWTGHFALYTTMLDRAFGTEWTDWGALQRKVLSEKPLTHLREQDPESGSSMPAPGLG